jgi:hypothetical protein
MILIEILNKVSAFSLTEENQSFPHDYDRQNPVGDLQSHRRRAENIQQIEH